MRIDAVGGHAVLSLDYNPTPLQIAYITASVIDKVSLASAGGPKNARWSCSKKGKTAAEERAKRVQLVEDLSMSIHYSSVKDTRNLLS